MTRTEYMAKAKAAAKRMGLTPQHRELEEHFQTCKACGNLRRKVHGAFSVELLCEEGQRLFNAWFWLGK
jgi:hypothetical protein